MLYQKPIVDMFYRFWSNQCLWLVASVSSSKLTLTTQWKPRIPIRDTRFLVVGKIWAMSAPWKIDMEHTNHPFRKETYLTNLHDYVPTVNLQGRNVLHEVGMGFSDYSGLSHLQNFMIVLLGSNPSKWSIKSVSIGKCSSLSPPFVFESCSPNTNF